MSQTMRAVTAPEPGGPDALLIETRPIPVPEEGQVRIKSAAAGINRPDILQRMGFYPPPSGASDILGLEVSGVIDAVGNNVARWNVGDAVCALLSGGGYADYAIADAGSVLPCPPCLDLTHCAGLPETVFTVWANVFESGALQPGETLLVHGGSSGIGTTAIQMAVAQGAKVIATAGSDEKCALCEGLGAREVINYRDQDFVEITRAEGGADVVLDMVGGDYVSRNLQSLKPGGRHVSIAFLNGSRVEIDMMPVMLKRLILTGSTLRARPVSEKARLASAIEATVWPWLKSGAVKPVIDSVHTLDDVANAHRRMDSGDHAGKILLSI